MDDLLGMNSGEQRKALTKKGFERLLKKAAQPLPKREPESGSKGIETSESRPSGDCSDRSKSQDMTEGSGV